jgi:hypothetical protein
MTALYDQLNDEQLETLRSFVERDLKQDTLTTGDIDIDEDARTKSRLLERQYLWGPIYPIGL